MTFEYLPLLVGLLAGIVVGGVVHELAHYAVLLASGIPCRFQPWPPRVFFKPTQPLSTEIRLAAVAPAVVGFFTTMALGVAAVAGAPFGLAEWLFFGGVIARLLQLSPQDRRVARGQLSSTRSRS